MRSGTRAGSKAKRPRFGVIGPGQFRELRLTVGWSVKRVSEFLRVTERTVRNWEAGATRCPYSAFKLLRVVGSRKLLGDAFGDAYVVDDVLVTTEGHKFAAADLGWWSLVVRQAQAWRDQMAKENGRTTALVTSAVARHCNAPAAKVRSKRLVASAAKAKIKQSGPILAPESVPFPRDCPAQDPQTPATRRVGPNSNTGQKSLAVSRTVVV